jgi:hypothetical protein
VLIASIIQIKGLFTFEGGSRVGANPELRGKKRLVRGE